MEEDLRNKKEGRASDASQTEERGGQNAKRLIQTNERVRGGGQINEKSAREGESQENYDGVEPVEIIQADE